MKAAEVTEGEDGTLYIEGIASDFETDRDMEAFEPGSFERGLKAYLASNPILLYHHRPHQQLGQVISAELDQKSLRIRAAIPKPPAGSWAEQVYDMVKRGMMRGLSVGGHFARHMTTAGPRIHDVDLQEISVTPLPVNPRGLFAIAGKAFADDEAVALERAVEGLEGVFAALERALG